MTSPCRGDVAYVGGLGRDEFFAKYSAPSEPSLCWDVKVGWVPVREIDPATGRPHTTRPGTEPRR